MPKSSKKSKTRKIGNYNLDVLPSGSLRLRKMYKGKNIAIVFDYEPTEREIVKALSEEIDKMPTTKKRITFHTAAEKYIEVKNSVLSPSTVRGYKSILSNIPDHFADMLISDIDSVSVQHFINTYSKEHSPKSTYNAHGFVVAVMAMFCPNKVFNTTLPQKVKNEPYIPSDEDIKKILDYAKGSMFEVPLILATFGLRRSEICALTLDDIKGNTLTINKAMVQDSDKNWVIKTTKTEAGTREIYLPDNVIELINNQGYIYKGYPNSIVCYLQKVQRKLGIPKFSLHKLRHYYASMSHAIGIPDSYIMASGGWKSDSTLKQVYRHALNDRKETMQIQAANYINEQILS